MPALLPVALFAAVRIGVFGLFHAAQIEVSPAPGSILVVETPESRTRLEGKQRKRFGAGARARISGPDALPVDFILGVPGKIERQFHGVLEIDSNGSELFAVVTMECELAVASIVAAESPPGAKLEALKAQAVVARSFLIASRARHAGFDFCDTTHCQFLRHPPPPASPAARATAETAGLVLQYSGRPIATYYSASCGGQTHPLNSSSLSESDYPYYAVDCSSCRRQARQRQGHGIGLCQRGAFSMAAEGATFRAILAHYFPATSLERLP